MKYFLLWSILASNIGGQVGPFNDLFACEKAAAQVLTLGTKLAPVRSVCVGDHAYPLHDGRKNGK